MRNNPSCCLLLLERLGLLGNCAFPIANHENLPSPINDLWINLSELLSLTKYGEGNLSIRFEHIKGVCNEENLKSVYRTSLLKTAFSCQLGCGAHFSTRLRTRTITCLHMGHGTIFKKRTLQV